MRAGVLVLVAAAALGACAYANGYDPSRYAAPAPSASVDPEIEPLPPSPKRRLRDPRGVPVFDAGVPVAAAALASAAANDGGASLALSCGAKGELCPMQRFMRSAMETAHTPESLAPVFSRLAEMSPDPAWTWAAIATRGAELAEAGDVARAKAQCVACHDAYREVYRTSHRARAL